jgi:hypothetical protein
MKTWSPEDSELIFETNGRVRLTRCELNDLRRLNARNGDVVNRVTTRDELLTATVGALPSVLGTDLLEFLETARSPMTTQPNAQASKR